MALDLDSIADGPIMPGGEGGASADEPIRPDKPASAPEADDDQIRPEPETPEAAEETSPADADEPIVSPAPAAAAPLELDDEAEIKIGNDTYKIKDLRDGQLMRADYTRKTQEIAAKERAMDEYRVETELNDIQTEDFVRRMDDPNEMINEFAAHKPEVWAAVEEYIIDRAIHLQGLSPEGRQLFLRDEADKRKAWQAKRDQRMQQTFAQHRTKAQARAEAQKNHGSWRADAMKSAGLSATRAEHHELLMDGMTSARNRGKPWTKELFDAEAARVAKTLGVKPPKQPKPAPTPIAAAPAAPPAAKLPPVRSPGNVPVQSAGGTRRGSSAPKDLGSFFDRVRNGQV